MKLKKVFLVLLTLCIVCGLTAVTAFADEVTAESDEIRDYHIDYPDSGSGGHVSRTGEYEYYSFAYPGDEVTLTALPNYGNVTTLFTVCAESPNPPFEYTVELSDVRHPDPNTLVFTMPAANVKVFTEFTQTDYSQNLVFICDMEGGTVVADKTIAARDETVTLTIRPDNGYAYIPGTLHIYEVDDYTHTETELPYYAVTEIAADSQYSFAMMSHMIYVRAEFEKRSEQTKYSVRVDDAIENGTISADPAMAEEGWTVRLTAEPDGYLGYALESLSVMDTDGNPIETEYVGGNVYSFIMPADNVFVTGTFAIPVYGITVENPDYEAAGCTIYAVSEAMKGEDVSVHVTLKSEMELASLTVTGDETGTDYSDTLQLSYQSDSGAVCIYKFSMPAEPVTVTGRFAVKTYEIRADESVSGTFAVTVNGEAHELPCRAAEGDTIGLTYTAPEYYTVDSLKYRIELNGSSYTINLRKTEQDDGTCTASFEMRSSDTTLLAELDKPVVTYVDMDRNPVGEHACDVVTADTLTWSSGWYVVMKDVDISERIEVSGDVILILCTDASESWYSELNVPKGIHVPEGASLTIWRGELGGKLTIENPDAGCAGIGGNSGENGGSVFIMSSLYTTVVAGEGAEAIGKGAGGADSGTLSIATGLAVYTGEFYSEATLTGERADACRTSCVEIIECWHSGSDFYDFYSEIDYGYNKTQHWGTCHLCGWFMEKEDHDFGYEGKNGYCYICHYNEVVVTYDPNGGLMYWTTDHLGKGEKLTLPEAPDYPVDGYIFEGWQVGTGSKLYAPGSEIVVNEDVTVKAIWKLDPWKELEVLVNEAPEGSTVVLKKDYTASIDSSPLCFSAKNITLDLNGHTINRNLKSYKSDGYAIRNTDDSTLTIRDTTGKGTIRGAYNNDEGGAIINEGTLNIIGVTFTENRTTDYGGAIFNDEGDLTLTNVIMTNNHASRGGAVYVDDGTLTVQGGSFKENEASRYGGALYIDGDASAAIDGDAVFSMNKAKSDTESTQGGAILNAGTLTINSGTFTQNIAIEGGAICNNELYYDALTTINGGLFKNNGASNGSAVYNIGGEVTVTGGEITANLAYGDGTETSGCGTIYNTSYGYDESILTITGGSIHDNTATFLGAGVYMDTGIFNIEGTPRIYDNTFRDWEGGNSVFLNDDTVMTVTGDLSQDALIYVDTNKQDVPVAITSGLKGHGTPDVFVSDSVNRFVLTNGYGEAVLGVPYLVSFDPGDDKGVLFSVIVAGAYPLPECDFDVPDGMQFKEWSVVIGDGETIHAQPGDEIMVTADTTIKAVWEEVKPAFRTQSIILSGQIGVNFFVTLPVADGLDYSDSYMTFSISGKGNITGRADLDPTFTNTTGEAYGFTCYVNAIQMADTITAVYHYQRNGAWETIQKQYAVRDYFAGFDSAVEKGSITDSGTIELVHAFADYGHYVQPFLSTVRGWKLGSDYAEQSTFYDVYSSDDIQAAKADTASRALTVENRTGGDIRAVTHSLTLDSETAINVFFQPAVRYRGSFTAFVDGESVSCERGKDGRWCVRIENIAAHKLSEDYTVTVITDNGTATVTVSALSYVNSALNYYGRNNAKAVNAVMAIYRYSKAADAYKAAHPDD